MASLQKKADGWYCQFYYHGKRHTFTIGKVPDAEAEAKSGQADYILMRLKLGHMHLPPGMDIVTFIEFDGKPPHSAPERKVLTLGDLKESYIATHEGNLEKSTLDGMRIHFNHLINSMGKGFPLPDLSLADLQGYVDKRRDKNGLHGKLSPATIRKEIVTLRTAWNWAAAMGRVSGKFPNKGLRYPRFTEKPPFQTWEEIERRTTGLPENKARAWWDCLYLRSSEISALLKHVQDKATQPWVYPLLTIAAYTGARRAEMLRMSVADVDFDGKTILIHEKKRAKNQTTTRRVPMAPILCGVLKDWIAVHPGGSHLFCQADVVRSRTRKKTPEPITHDEAHDQLKRALKGSKWEVLRGYHVLRHSFISACASKGIDQRLIDEWSGHATEQQRKRYRHLYPSTQQAAIASVFGK